MITFDAIGKLILYHKYLYYVVGQPIISDAAYDLLEKNYITLAKTLEIEPAVHMIDDWSELKINNGFHASCVIGFPHDHAWAEEVIDNYLNSQKGNL
jgi:NAD-dependent DNA ligase